MELSEQLQSVVDEDSYGDGVVDVGLAFDAEIGENLFAVLESDEFLDEVADCLDCLLSAFFIVGAEHDFLVDRVDFVQVIRVNPRCPIVQGDVDEVGEDGGVTHKTGGSGVELSHGYPLWLGYKECLYSIYLAIFGVLPRKPQFNLYQIVSNRMWVFEVMPFYLWDMEPYINHIATCAYMLHKKSSTKKEEWCIKFDDSMVEG